MASKLGRWVCAFSIATGLVSCNPWSVNSQQQQSDKPFISIARNNSKIVAIAALSDLEQGIEIKIQGTVAQTAPFINGGAYEITDSTGSIWVITETSPPASGTKIQVAGQLKFHDLQLGNSNFGEIFITENQTLEPTAIEEPQTNNVTPPKRNLESYLLPHKENSK
ncbi:hypothetical protein Lepto7376_4380 [[Leptolyngbya] sp. PCC 7376]|uniref:hypothetical protein n=1 Tax=[Leptolyngbya] sp. PCC 7376 TaxID=111781 RepID=UPI00029EE1C4|nr:hypothetical protein [[Leptolyngbya] sp. PCC 7376]AFY40488.1 hypothetical protein Lepto7376_4380 [[Leptolyngbya] sp. PCC 7376]